MLQWDRRHLPYDRVCNGGTGCRHNVSIRTTGRNAANWDFHVEFGSFIHRHPARSDAGRRCSRTLTVVMGATGIGKTQLAIQFANAGQHQDGERGILFDMTSAWRES